MEPKRDSTLTDIFAQATTDGGPQAAGGAGRTCSATKTTVTRDKAKDRGFPGHGH